MAGKTPLQQLASRIEHECPSGTMWSAYEAVADEIERLRSRSATMAHDPRTLSDEEIASINSIKTHGDALAQQILALKGAGADPRWLAIGGTNLQQGIMALCRAVAKPEGF